MKEAFQAEGDVETLDLLAALCALGREGSTGRAIFSRGPDRIVFVVERGVLVDLEAPGESSAPEVLVRSGKLQRETYEALVIPPGEDRFAIATASGVVSKKEAAWGRKISAIESLAHLLSWTEGSYVFEPLAPEITTGFRLSIDKWILELFLRSNDRALVMSHVGPTDLPLLKSDTFAPAFATLGLTADADAVASLIDGERSVEEIVRKSRADEFAVLKLLAALISLRLVRPSYESPFPEAAEAPVPGDVPADALQDLPEASPSASAEFRTPSRLSPNPGGAGRARSDFSSAFRPHGAGAGGTVRAADRAVRSGAARPAPWIGEVGGRDPVRRSRGGPFLEVRPQGTGASPVGGSPKRRAKGFHLQEPARKSIVAIAPQPLSPPKASPEANKRRAAAPWKRTLEASRRAFQHPGAFAYAIQLELACEEATVTKALRADPSGRRIWIVPYDFRGRSCYRVLWGRYRTLPKARDAKSSVPAMFLRGGNRPAVIALSGAGSAAVAR